MWNRWLVSSQYYWMKSQKWSAVWLCWVWGGCEKHVMLESEISFHSLVFLSFWCRSLFSSWGLGQGCMNINPLLCFMPGKLACFIAPFLCSFPFFSLFIPLTTPLQLFPTLSGDGRDRPWERHSWQRWSSCLGKPMILSGRQTCEERIRQLKDAVII